MRIYFELVVGPGTYELRKTQSAHAAPSDVVKVNVCSMDLSVCVDVMFVIGRILDRMSSNTIENLYHHRFLIRNLPMVSKRMMAEHSCHRNHRREMDRLDQRFTIHRLVYVECRDREERVSGLV